MHMLALRKTKLSEPFPLAHRLLATRSAEDRRPQPTIHETGLILRWNISMEHSVEHLLEHSMEHFDGTFGGSFDETLGGTFDETFNGAFDG